MKLLCTGDIHIGRRPTRLPEGIDSGTFSAAAAWERCVDFAIARQVDAVALTGDVVDRDNRFFEAYGPLERGARRLADAGIDVVAVAGNHDHDVLPRLTRELPGGKLHLLGQKGKWERFTLQRSGETIHFDGWSFPSEHVLTSPLVDYPFTPEKDGPTIGLLHADVDQPSSRYGPVTLADLRAKPVNLWLLGHIHRPTCFAAEAGSPTVLYPGSPQGLDPGEVGPHGPWSIEINANGHIDLQHVPLAPLRYATWEVDVTGIDEPEDVESHLIDAIRERLRSCREESDRLAHLRCRLRLTGRTRAHRDLESRLSKVCSDLEVSSADAAATIDRVSYDTRPALDLQDLAQGASIPATLARLILELENTASTSDGTVSLINEVRERMDDVCRARAYQVIRDASPDAEQTKEMIKRQGLLLLDTLIAQQERPA